ncbi:MULTISPECIES: exodeoxyribonuclease VII small subunit [Enterococcaceae]|uniref:exodeoxyribonuclease VII small subunit n=1 Tax=Enterococcaceae TaxID=81852 RepID=UPI000E4D1EBF|nr:MULTISPECIES: exodeoxyribonuclease VII small subunit [Enterococcaceae]MCI0130471.1 exodeoxyribonuclease VII small subunit [Vagococcus sp. CY53-2]RGI32198.1 exodeoxyribonuclease VII small subunit [Melissococcus sp. OM08-11BH]UNM89906.1 exodeoxyribonuclease VII small subunit [Vagococcus sp. CY52-2]
MTKEKQTFEESMEELETIIKGLESGDVPLEIALEKFQRGVELSKQCQETLANAEKTLTKVMSQDGQEIEFEAKGE